MKKLLIFFVFIASVMATSGCSFNPLLNNNTVISEEDRQKLATTIIEDSEKASKEFLLTINADEISEPVMIHSNGQYVECSNMKVIEAVFILGLEAYYSGDETAINDYLKKHNLFDSYNDIMDKYKVKENTELYNSSKAKTDSMSTLSIPNKSYEYYCNGDIFLSSSTKFFAGFIPGYWKHAGIFNKDKYLLGNRYAILTAYGNFLGSSGGVLESGNNCVGYESVDHIASDDDFTIRRVSPFANEQAGGDAIRYSEQFLYKPYSLLPDADNDNENWNCSKVPYRGWKSQSVFTSFYKDPNLHYLGLISAVVIPQDLANNTYDLSYPVILKDPANDHEFHPGDITFDWYPSSFVTNYLLDIVNRDSGTTTTYTVVHDDPKSIVSYTASMNQVGQYVWKISTTNVFGRKVAISGQSYFNVRETGSLSVSLACIKTWLGQSSNVTICWVASCTNSWVYCSDNGEEDTLIGFYSGIPDTNSIQFVGQTGHAYQFTLYSSADKTYLLDSKTVNCPQKWKDDIITVDSAGLNIYSSDGSGFYTLKRRDNVGSILNSGISGDFNGDGFDDALVTLSIPHVSGNIFQVALSDGSGFHLMPNTNFISENIVKAADFNGDGWDELLLFVHEPNPYGGYYPFSSIHFYQFPGSGGPAINSITNIYNLVSAGAGDFNGDGKADVLCLYADCAVVRESGGNTYAGFSLSNTCTMNGVVVGDFDGDGKDDLAVSYIPIPHFPSVFKILISTGNGFVDLGTLRTPAPEGYMISGDFNRDNKNEIGFIVSSNGTARLNAYSLTGNALNDMGTILSPGYGESILGIANVDGN